MGAQIQDRVPLRTQQFYHSTLQGITSVVGSDGYAHIAKTLKG